METLISYLVFMILPLSMPLIWLYSLASYLIGRFQNKRVPGAVPANKMERRLIFLIVSSVLFGVVIAWVLAIFHFLSQAVIYM